MRWVRSRHSTTQHSTAPPSLDRFPRTLSTTLNQVPSKYVHGFVGVYGLRRMVSSRLVLVTLVAPMVLCSRMHPMRRSQAQERHLAPPPPQNQATVVTCPFCASAVCPGCVMCQEQAVVLLQNKLGRPAHHRQGIVVRRGNHPLLRVVVLALPPSPPQKRAQSQEGVAPAQRGPEREAPSDQKK